MVTTLRPAGPLDAVLGVLPRMVAEPDSVEEAAECLKAAARDRLRMVFVGGGTDLGLGAPPSGLDLVVRTGRLNRIIEHAPADQIVVAEAGVTMAALKERLAPHGQRLALDPPFPERATLGGVLAANAYGPRRTRYGAARDLVIGASFVRADGVLARGGGKVVKNVAGFDLPRLLVGSLGTLGLVATVTFRLHPLPEAEATLLVEKPSADAVRAIVLGQREARLEPSSMALYADPDPVELGVRFEGFRPGVAQQVERLALLAERLGQRASILDDAAAHALWERDLERRTRGPLRLRIVAPPSSLSVVVRDVVRPLADALDGSAVLDPTLLLGTLSGSKMANAFAAPALRLAREQLGALGGSLVVADAPPDIRAAFDPWGPPPPSLAIMRRLKVELDPEGRLAPGRFVGGI